MLLSEIQYQLFFSLYLTFGAFFIPSLNLIIEFNGDYWHCNPNKYDKDYYHIIKQKKSKDIWEEDQIRVDNIKKNGYNLEVIWECDLKTPYYLNTILKKYERKD